MHVPWKLPDCGSTVGLLLTYDGWVFDLKSKTLLQSPKNTASHCRKWNVVSAKLIDEPAQINRKRTGSQDTDTGRALDPPEQTFQKPIMERREEGECKKDAWGGGPQALARSLRTAWQGRLRFCCRSRLVERNDQRMYVSRGLNEEQDKALLGCRYLHTLGTTRSVGGKRQKETIHPSPGRFHIIIIIIAVLHCVSSKNSCI